MLIATATDSIPTFFAPDIILCVAVAPIDAVKLDPMLVFVPVTLIVVVGIMPLDPNVLAIMELVVMIGVLTRNQLAATGVPKPASSANVVRLNPIRLTTEAVKLLKNEM